MTVVEKIFDYISNTDKKLVFCTQTAAVSCLEYYSKKNPGKAVFYDKVMSWDSFADILIDHAGKEKADYIDRCTFAYSFLKKKENFESIKYFSNPIYPEALKSFAFYIAKLLVYFPNLLRENYRKGVSDKMLCDIEILSKAYKEYLDSRFLYESSYLIKNLDNIDNSYVLVFPQLFSDLSVTDVINSGKCEVIDIPECKNSTSLYVYKNSISEIRSIFRKIRKLLISGVDPDGIVISCPCIDSYRPYMEVEAEKRDIKLSFSSGNAYTNYPQGRFFVSLRRIKNENYSYESVRDFLMDVSFPFARRDFNMTVLDIAVRCKIKNGGKSRWLSAIEFVERVKEKAVSVYDIAEIYSYFKGIADFIECFTGSKKCEEMFSAFEDFRDKYFCTDVTFGKNDSLLGSCLEVLSVIEKRNIHLDFPVFELFIDILTNKNYVEKSTGGIKVYSYPVSASVFCSHHFVIGLDDTNTTVVSARYPFLNSECACSTNLTPYFLNAYSNTLFSPEISLSCSLKGFDGTKIVPSFFSSSVISASTQETDSYTSEYSMWRSKNDSDKDESPSLYQKRSFESACASVLKYNRYKNKYPYCGDIEAGISAVTFRDFSRCPYSGYVQVILNLKEKETEITDPDARVIGIILHKTYQNALEEKKSLYSLDEDILGTMLDNAVDEALRDNLIGSKINALYIKKHYTGAILKAIKDDAYTNALLSGNAELYKNEVTLEAYPLPGMENLKIKGRADTIIECSGNVYILDYKISGKDDYSSNIEEVNPQLALYARSLEKSGFCKNVAGVAYYSVNEGKMHVVWPVVSYEGARKTYTSGFSRQEVEKDLEARIERVKDSFKNSDFSATESNIACRNCSYFCLCRRRFAVK